MKVLLLSLSVFVSFAAQAQQFNNLTKKDVENITREFGANFAHTTVAAPETDGMWGIEAGVVAGQTSTPELKKIVENSGGDGSDFESLYHAAFFGRVHVPGELFAELSLLPEQEFSDVSIQSRSYALGWNAGRFFRLPFDVALAAERSNGKMSFSQTSPVPSDITLDTTTTNYWVGVSKSFLIFTPYLKYGRSSIEGELSTTASIFGYTSSTKQDVSPMSGGFLAVGANVELGFLKLGVEASQIVDVKRVSAKLSLDF